MAEAALESRVERIVRDFADNAPAGGRLEPRLSLRDDLGIESLALVSLVVRLGDELGGDVADEGLALDGLRSVADVIALARRLAR